MVSFTIVLLLAFSEQRNLFTGTNSSRFLFKPFRFFDRSSDAKYLAVSSRDCFCTIIEFENEELGLPYNLSGISLSSLFLFCWMCLFKLC